MTEYERARFDVESYVAGVQADPCFICEFVARGYSTWSFRGPTVG